jgi:hypothetical protein
MKARGDLARAIRDRLRPGDYPAAAKPPEPFRPRPDHQPGGPGFMQA